MGRRMEPARSKTEPKHPIDSVNNALRLLLLFGNGEPIRISEASRHLGVVPSTAHRLMAMLAYHDFVEKDPATRAYRAGPALTVLALRALRQIDSRDYIHGLLSRLTAVTDETVHFVKLDRSEVTFVDGIESEKPVRATLRIGARRPAHCTSGGKAMLAELSHAELRAIYPRSKLSTCTPRSIAGFKALELQLADVRELGYALSVGESEAEIAAIGVAIHNPEGRLMGGLSISMPISRFREEDVARHVEALRTVADDTYGTMTAAALGGRD